MLLGAVDIELVPCSYGVPHSTLSCGMVVGSNKCPIGYSCAAGAADEFFACCPTKPSPSPPPPPTLPGKSKPGSCPKPKPGTAGICLQRCNGDFDCRGNEKCCSNGCGNECLDPEVPPSSTQLPPFPSSACSIGIPNTKLKCGLVVGSNKCTNGYSCVPGPADEPPVCCRTRKTKPGSCPIPKSEMAGICLQRCNGDFDCRGNAKCCSNGCGNECSNPEDNDPKCRVGQHLSNIFCGRGPNRQDCPKGYYCNVHPTDKYAVCCRNDNVPICRLGQPLSNINCGRGPNRQNCPKGYYCNIHPTDKYAVCCRNGYGGTGYGEIKYGSGGYRGMEWRRIGYGVMGYGGIGYDSSGYGGMGYGSGGYGGMNYGRSGYGGM
ncbi:unnamed protein product [Mytilus coruscus]|uniref:WAP domain-containing protein n=1 Tax=Mytilus coruscus TaxID=42192 RepID=A0A6J8C2B6_MYTCO|nr:unnamed protein product [Mytilus coruscus]